MYVCMYVLLGVLPLFVLCFCVFVNAMNVDILVPATTAASYKPAKPWTRHLERLLVRFRNVCFLPTPRLHHCNATLVWVDDSGLETRCQINGSIRKIRSGQILRNMCMHACQDRVTMICRRSNHNRWSWLFLGCISSKQDWKCSERLFMNGVPCAVCKTMICLVSVEKWKCGTNDMLHYLFV